MISNNFIKDALKKYPKANTMAVDNFCFTAPDNATDNSMNLNDDTRLYKWNVHTVNAIRYVLKKENKI